MLATVLVLIPTVAFLLVENSRFQTLAANRFLTDFSNKLGTEIKVRKVKMSFLRNIVLEDLLILDQQYDTMVYVPKLKVNLDSVSVKKQYLHFNNIALYNPDIRLEKYEEKNFNFTFIIDSLSSQQDTTKVKKGPWDISPGKIRFYDGKINYKADQMPLNLSNDIRLSELDLNLQIYHLKKDSMHVELKHLSYAENSGYDLRNLKTDVYYSRLHGFKVDEFKWETDKSQFHFEDFYLIGDSVFSSTAKFEQSQKGVTINNSRVAISDLAFLYEPLKHSNSSVTLKGQAVGGNGSVDYNDFSIEVPKTFLFNFSGQLVDIFHPNETFFYADFKQMFVQTDRMSELMMELQISNPALWDKLTKLGNVTYTGQLTGLPGDYVMFGTFTTSLGQIKSDISVKTQPNQMVYNGQVATTNFNLSPFVDNSKLLGNITMSVEAQGLFENQQFQGMNVNGYIEKVDINKYPYSNIDLNGYISPRLFNGAIAINDPNLDVNFFGRLDFTGELPDLQFEAEVESAKLGQIKKDAKFPDANIQLNFKANVLGDKPDNFDGFFTVKDIAYTNNRGTFDIDSVRFSFKPHNNIPEIRINSSIMEGSVIGNYHFASLVHSAKNVFMDYLPALKKDQSIPKDTTYNNFNFECTINPFDTIAYVLDVPYFVYQGMNIQGELNDYEDRASVRMNIPLADFNGFFVSDFDLYLRNGGQKRLMLNASATSCEMRNRTIENLSVNATMVTDSAYTKLVWNNNDIITNSGNISSSVAFNRTEEDKLFTQIYINPSSIILADSQWVMPQSEIEIKKEKITIHNFKLQNDERYFNVDGIISKNEEDSVTFNISNFELAYIHKLLHPAGISFAGTLNGSSTINGMLANPLIQAEMSIDNAHFNEVNLGVLDLTSEWDDDKEQLNIAIENHKDENIPLVAKGIYAPGNDSIDLHMNLNNLDVAILRPFLNTVVQNASGHGYGELALKGKLSKPYFEGSVNLRNASVDIDYLKTTYYLNDPIKLEQNRILFDHVRVHDKDGNKGELDGYLTHRQFQDMAVNLEIQADNLNILNTTKKDNELFYGTVYGTGWLTIEGANQNVFMDANITTKPNSFLYLPINATSSATENDFISFVGNQQNDEETVYRKVNTNESTSKGVFSLNLDVNATTDTRVELIFDETLGEKITGQGTGLMSFNYVSDGDFTMNGEYRLTKGDYLFTLFTMINKSFQLEPGSTIRWNGSPFDATINLDAYYRTRAPLYDLMPTAANAEELKKRFPVQCHMMLTNSLMRPDIKFDIILPTAEDETQQSVRSIINTEDEMSRQVISLLTFNRFYTPDYMKSGLEETQSNSQAQAAAVTASEFLSSQVSNWASQFSENVDLGFSYRPGDNTYTNQEFEAMLSTQLWDDRIEFNGTVGYRDTKNTTVATENATSFIGDFEVFFKLNEQYRFKAYSKTNDNFYYDTSPTTQGVGIIYKEDFNNLKDLIESRKERKKARKERREEKKDQKENPDSIINEDDEQYNGQYRDNPYQGNDSIQ